MNGSRTGQASYWHKAGRPCNRAWPSLECAFPSTSILEFDGASHVQATRVATLDELEKAIGAIDEDIERLVQGTPRLVFDDYDVEQLRQEKAALTELRKRVGRSGCPGSTTVIESLFPDIPVKKKTSSEKAEIERWRAIRKEAALKIDPETAEVDWHYAQTLDPYGVCDEWELPEEFHQVGHEYFARSPGSDVWAHFGDLPEDARDRLWKKHSRKLAFPAGFEGMPTREIEDGEVPL